MADTYLATEYDPVTVEKILKLPKQAFNGTKDFDTWLFDIRIPLERFKLYLHLTMDDTDDLDVIGGNAQQNTLNTCRMENQFTVY